MADKEAVKVKAKDALYSKDALCKQKRFKNRADLLGVLLEDSKKYTIADTQKAIDKFMGVSK